MIGSIKREWVGDVKLDKADIDASSTNFRFVRKADISAQI